MKEYQRTTPDFSLCGLNCCLCPRFWTGFYVLSGLAWESSWNCGNKKEANDEHRHIGHDPARKAGFFINTNLTTLNTMLTETQYSPNIDFV